MVLRDVKDYKGQVQETIGYEFKKNVVLLLQAFTRASYSVEHGGENNEVLEFIGDKVLDVYVIKAFATKFGFYSHETEFFDEFLDKDEFCIRAHKDESQFTELKNKLVCNENLATIIDKLDLARFLYLGKCDIANEVWNHPKVKADLLEAIIGAVALDCDWNDTVLTNLVNRLLELDKYIDTIDKGLDVSPRKFTLDNSIMYLKELFEHGYITEPVYEIPDMMTPIDGVDRWTVDVYIKSHNIHVGSYGDTKKEAKRYTAYLALCRFYHDVPEE